MSTCKLEESEQDLEDCFIKAASSYVHTLLARFETYFPSHQTTELKSKLWLLNPFGKQQPLGPLNNILKNDFCQKSFFSRGKHAEFWVRALNGSYRACDPKAQHSCAKFHNLLG